MEDPERREGGNVVLRRRSDTQALRRLRPAEVRLYRYRVPQGSSSADPNLGGIGTVMGHELTHGPWLLGSLTHVDARAH